MFKEDPVIRLYTREYCEELFPAKWREHSPVTLPWMFVAGSFNKALAHFYSQNTLVAKLLGNDNIDATTRAFYLENISVELGLEFKYSEDTIKLSSSASEYLKLLKPSEAQDQFKSACDCLGFEWLAVKNTLVPLLDKLYKEQLIMVKVSPQNAAALGLAFEDEESVDLKVRLKLSAVPPPAPSAPAA